MYRQTLDIRGFNRGLMTTPDTEDIPLDASSDCTNLNPIADGLLSGQSDADIAGETIGGFAAVIGTYLSNGSTYSLVTDKTSAISIATSLVSHNNEIHVGYDGDIAKWHGYPGHGYLGGSNPGLVTVDAECSNLTDTTYGVTAISLVSAVSTEDTSLFFQIDDIHQYVVSFIYDGYQESPIGGISKLEKMVILNSSSTEWGSNISAKGATLTIKIPTTPTGAEQRITSVNLYRKDYDSSTNTWSAYQLLKSIDVVGSTGWTAGEYSYSDEGDYGVTFEQNSGYSETLTTTTVDYKLGCDIAGYHFVADIEHDLLGTEHSMMMRSLPGRYDTFDWSNDFLKLPIYPKALVAYQGRVYAMNESQIVRINPFNFAIEDSTIGAGVSHVKSVATTEFGMFFANKSQVYWHNGSRVEPIASVIEDVYQTAAGANTPVLVFDSLKNILIVAAGSTIFAYSIVRKRWDELTSSVSYTGGITTLDGVASLFPSSTSTSSYIIGHSSNKRSWTWVSQDFTFGDVGQDKKFYYIYINGGTPNTMKYSLDYGGTPLDFTSGTQLPITTKGNTLRIELEGDSSTEVNSISIVYRPLKGKR